MDIVILIIGLVFAGLFAGWLAGPIWKNKRPIGVAGDYIATIVTAVVVGLMDWFVIPAMGFSDTIKIIGVITEPFLAALLVLWIIRKAKR